MAVAAGQPAQPDIVDVLVAEHTLLRRLAPRVTDAGDTGSGFWAWSDRVVRHEIGEELVVYPVLLASHGGAAVAHSRLEEQAGVERRLVTVGRLEPGTAAFREQAAALVSVHLAHLELEEAQVLPILSSRVGTARRLELGRRFREVTRAEPRVPPPEGSRQPVGRTVVDRTEALSVWLRDVAGRRARDA